MKHQTLEQLQTVAEVHPGQQRPVMTRANVSNAGRDCWRRNPIASSER